MVEEDEELKEKKEGMLEGIDLREGPPCTLR